MESGVRWKDTIIQCIEYLFCVVDFFIFQFDQQIGLFTTTSY